VTKLLFLGGGHSHGIALKYLARHPIPGAQLQLLHPGTQAIYSGMIPGHLSGQYTRATCQIDLQRLAHRAGAKLIQDEAIALDLSQHQVICKTGRSIGFDLLSINTGSVPTLPPGIKPGDRILAIKPLGAFLDQWERLETTGQFQAQSGVKSGVKSIAIVGAGLGGIEVALNLKARLGESVAIEIFCSSPTIAEQANRSLQQFLTQTLNSRQMTTHLRSRVIAATEQGEQVKLTYGQENFFTTQEFSAVIFVTQGSAPNWLKDSGLATDDRGFVSVEKTLQSRSHESVFATGDIAAMVGVQIPKSGVFAVRQGIPLAQNLSRRILNLPLIPHHPQHTALSLLNLSGGRAVGSYGAISLTHPLFHSMLSLLKDHIDRRFIRSF
jgi:selenide, water dikinase